MTPQKKSDEAKKTNETAGLTDLSIHNSANGNPSDIGQERWFRSDLASLRGNEFHCCSWSADSWSEVRTSPRNPLC